MPRIKTKGDAIALRLPLHLDNIAHEAADEANQTVQEWISDQLCALISNLELSPRVAARSGGADEKTAAKRMLDSFNR